MLIDTDHEDRAKLGLAVQSAVDELKLENVEVLRGGKTEVLYEPGSDITPLKRRFQDSGLVRFVETAEWLGWRELRTFRPDSVISSDGGRAADQKTSAQPTKISIVVGPTSDTDTDGVSQRKKEASQRKKEAVGRASLHLDHALALLSEEGILEDDVKRTEEVRKLLHSAEILLMQCGGDTQQSFDAAMRPWTQKFGPIVRKEIPGENAFELSLPKDPRLKPETSPWTFRLLVKNANRTWLGKDNQTSIKVERNEDEDESPRMWRPKETCELRIHFRAHHSATHNVLIQPSIPWSIAPPTHEQTSK